MLDQNTSSIRYAVVGTSWITRSLIKGAFQHSHLQLAAVYSRTRERGEAFAAEVGAKNVYTDLEAMATDPTIDMVYVASPNSCHTAQCRLFLQHGKHVLCEKPLSANPDEVAALQKLAADNHLLFREAIMMLYQPRLGRLQEAIMACGRISMVHFDFCQLSSKYEAYCRGEIPNIFNPALHTGALMDLGVYCVYPAVFFFGEPTAVSATATFLSTGADGAGSALLSYPDKQVVLTYSKTGQGEAPSQIVGDKGTVTIGSISKLEDIVFTPYGGKPEKLFGSADKETMMGNEINGFSQTILNGQRPEDFDRYALQVSRTMAAIRRSAGIHFPNEN